jgi:glycosyltransferase involved in cell wall biosynthesis
LQPGFALDGKGFWSRHAPGLIAELEKLAPEWLLVYGYASRMNWVAVHWAKRHGVKVAYMSDSNIHDPRRRLIQPLKKLLLGYFFGRLDAFLSTSEANAEYLQAFGVGSQRIHRLPFSIDIQRFAAGAPVPGADRHYDFVWAGKFMAIKRPQDFIAALPGVASAAGRPIRACMVGDGSLRSSLEEQAATLPPDCQLDFPGFVNQAGMPEVLHRGHTLVLSSEQEAYGLIATEAAAAGLALIVADRVGCVGPSVLAREGVNALTYRAGDVVGLAAAMQKMVGDPALRVRMQRASVDIASLHDLDHAAAAIEKIVSGGGRDA